MSDEGETEEKEETNLRGFGDPLTECLSLDDPSIRCIFCRRFEVRRVEWGGLFKLHSTVSHHFCLLFSALMSQNGSDEEGIQGFLPKDIEREVRRGKKLRCKYCRRPHATIGCYNSKCSTSYHFPCGQEAGSLFEFQDQFRSYCVKHKPKQTIPKGTDPMCYICMVETEPGGDAILPPCCRKSLFHRSCLSQAAHIAGYFFKCPLCNSTSDKFMKAMKGNGVFVPEKDAEWETEPDAFQELLQVYSTCDTVPCLCPEGPDFDSSEWQIARCTDCGSSATHLTCANLTKSIWTCPSCTAITKKKPSPKVYKARRSAPLPPLRVEKRVEIKPVEVSVSSSEDDDVVVLSNSESSEESDEDWILSQTRKFKKSSPSSDYLVSSDSESIEIFEKKKNKGYMILEDDSEEDISVKSSSEILEKNEEELGTETVSQRSTSEEVEEICESDSREREDVQMNEESNETDDVGGEENMEEDESETLTTVENEPTGPTAIFVDLSEINESECFSPMDHSFFNDENEDFLSQVPDVSQEAQFISNIGEEAFIGEVKKETLTERTSYNTPIHIDIPQNNLVIIKSEPLLDIDEKNSPPQLEPEGEFSRKSSHQYDQVDVNEEPPVLHSESLLKICEKSPQFKASDINQFEADDKICQKSPLQCERDENSPPPLCEISGKFNPQCETDNEIYERSPLPQFETGEKSPPPLCDISGKFHPQFETDNEICKRSPLPQFETGEKSPPPPPLCEISGKFHPLCETDNEICERSPLLQFETDEKSPPPQCETDNEICEKSPPPQCELAVELNEKSECEKIAERYEEAPLPQIELRFELYNKSPPPQCEMVNLASNSPFENNIDPEVSEISTSADSIPHKSSPSPPVEHILLDNECSIEVDTVIKTRVVIREGDESQVNVVGEAQVKKEKPDKLPVGMRIDVYVQTDENENSLCRILAKQKERVIEIINLSDSEEEEEVKKPNVPIGPNFLWNPFNVTNGLLKVKTAAGKTKLRNPCHELNKFTKFDQIPSEFWTPKGTGTSTSDFFTSSRKRGSSELYDDKDKKIPKLD